MNPLFRAAHSFWVLNSHLSYVGKSILTSLSNCQDVFAAGLTLIMMSMLLRNTYKAFSRISGKKTCRAFFLLEHKLNGQVITGLCPITIKGITWVKQQATSETWQVIMYSHN